MQLSVNTVLKTLDGEPIMTGAKNEIKLTVKLALCEALLSFYQDENPNQQVKMDRWVLAKKVHTSESSVDLTVEDCAKIKEMVFKRYIPFMLLFVEAYLSKLPAMTFYFANVSQRKSNSGR